MRGAYRRLSVLPVLGFVVVLGCATPRQPATSSWPAGAELRGANITTGLSREDLRHFSKDWGGKAVRILHLTPLAEQAPFAPKKAVVEAIFAAADLAIQQGLVVVICPGVSMENHDSFFANAAYRRAFTELWRTIAKRYRDNPAIIAYDLMNEPHDSLANIEWPLYARELTAAVREIDTRHTLMIEPPEWGWPAGFIGFEPTGDSNTIYSFHFYGPMDFTSQRGYDDHGKFKGFMEASEADWNSRVYPGPIQGENWDRATLETKLTPAFQFQNRFHVPLWCGEFGTARWARGALQWLGDLIDVLEAHQIGWAYYSYREWQPMDLEMDPRSKNKATGRTDTDFVRLLKAHFKR